LICKNRNLGRAGQPVPPACIAGRSTAGRPFGSVGQGCPTLPSTVAPMCDVRSGSNLIFLFGIPAIWVGFEYARAHFLTGFPWDLLGVSQYAFISLIQCADWGGVYLVSYLIVMGNTAFALLIRAFLKERINPEQVLGEVDGQVRHCGRVEGMIYHRREGIIKPAIGPVLFFLILFLALGYGKWRLVQSPEKLETIRTAAVQLNVPQQLKWSEEWADDIYRRLKESTAAAGKAPHPDLIVWPETALPDFVRYGEADRKAVREALGCGIPLLAGSMDYEVLPGKTLASAGQTNYYNSSFLFLPGQSEPQVYAKRHLVIFGEYVPLANYLPFLRSVSGVEEDFTPGAKNVVFRLNNGGKNFSVLICFEDTLPYLARECVNAGARLLINQTNDAWFDPWWASRQHMAHCVFRCVENRVACLRAANTGLTCYIDRFGLIRSSLAPLGRASREPQIMRSELEFSPEKMPLTFYTRHGDLFALACAAFSLPLFIGALLNFRGQGRGFLRISKRLS